MTGLVTTVAGSVNFDGGGLPITYGHADGEGTNVLFHSPVNLAMDAAGTFALIVSGLSRASVCEGLCMWEMIRFLRMIVLSGDLVLVPPSSVSRIFFFRQILITILFGA